jgi:capsular exopolysaccharide synthesis family protein
MIKKELVVAKDPRSPISENFRGLRTNLQFMNAKDTKNQTILITSTSPSEGKSWTSSNIAIAYSQAGKKTCLVDVDMRKGRLYAMFNLSPTPGVSNYLTGVNIENGEDILQIVQETELPNLHVLTAGNIPPNPSELLITNKTRKMVDELKNNFDVVIFDGTPCDLVTDATIVSRLVDQTIIVAAYNSTKMEDLKETKKTIENAGGKVSGIVFNKLPMSTRKYGDKYYYGYSPKKK